MGFFRFLLGVAIFFFFTRVLVYYVLPWFVKRKLEKMQAQQGRQYENRKEGEITVEESAPKKEYSNKSNVGEYIDFEEVD